MRTISEERTNFAVIVGLHVRAVSEFREKKIQCDLRFIGVFLYCFAVFGPHDTPSY